MIFFVYKYTKKKLFYKIILTFFAFFFSLMKRFYMTESNKNDIYPRFILGLDVSTACIGVSIVKDNGNDDVEILYLSHKTPTIPRRIKGIETLFLKKQIFEDEFIKDIMDTYPITDVVIEEPLPSSNNINTVTTLLRYNGMIAESIYRIMGIVPNFISSYDARMYSFPELVALRKYNKKGDEYDIKHIKNALKKGNIVLFGAYPFDVDKKSVMMNMVNETYNDCGIEWLYNNKGVFQKENYDACDSLICVLAYVNINHHGLEKPRIKSYNIVENDDNITVFYETEIWDRVYQKKVILSK